MLSRLRRKRRGFVLLRRGGRGKRRRRWGEAGEAETLGVTL